MTNRLVSPGVAGGGGPIEKPSKKKSHTAQSPTAAPRMTPASTTAGLQRNRTLLGLSSILPPEWVWAWPLLGTSGVAVKGELLNSQTGIGQHRKAPVGPSHHPPLNTA